MAPANAHVMWAPVAAMSVPRRVDATYAYGHAMS